MKNTDPKTFMVYSDAKGLLAIVKNYALIILVIYISFLAHSIPVYILCAWLIGVFQFALSELLTHDASHFTLFKTRLLNTMCEWLTCIPFFFTMKQYRLEHMIHHNLLGKKGDRDIENLRSQGLITEKPNLVWACTIRPLLGLTGLDYFKKTAQLKNLKVCAFWIPVLIISIHTHTTVDILLYWIIPFIWSCNSFAFWTELQEHYQLKKQHSTTNTSFLYNLLFHDGGYHFTHHEYPRIPWHQLKKAYHELHEEKSLEKINTFFHNTHGFSKKDSLSASNEIWYAGKKMI